MYVVWLSPGGSGGFTGISRDAEIFPGFSPPQAALVTVASGEKGLWVVCCNSGELILRLRQRVGNPHWHDYGLMVRVVRLVAGINHVTWEWW